MQYVNPAVRENLKVLLGKGCDAELLYWFSRSKDVQLRFLLKIMRKKIAFTSRWFFKDMTERAIHKRLSIKECHIILATYSNLLQRGYDKRVKISINDSKEILINRLQ